ncbi:hypothetical protein TNCV_949421 [Trichonephila clavipes]|nr:hypothetical protein TNCV_949421 [Trichonephila clavipes]
MREPSRDSNRLNRKSPGSSEEQGVLFPRTLTMVLPRSKIQRALGSHGKPWPLWVLFRVFWRETKPFLALA